ncbi:MAG TPA: ABC transporter ATP-binding protein [Casimicrobiaceae bacterium]|nr:ABC transporter ATP-binding protein [Casimicrobiaceae bacterium]
MSPSLLHCTDLHAHLGESHVLRGLSLSIARGESIGLLGRNGMGKTTFMRTLLGHVRASRGRVSVRGLDCTNDRPDRIARRGVAYVPEGRGIFPNLTVRENLVFGARTRGDARSQWTLERVLDIFPRLAERLAHGGQQLSGGEQQMLAIGRALMTNPDLILLDEATEGLAPLVVREIWRIVEVIRASGIASLIVDRNIDAVLACTDRIALMEKGRLILEGSSSEFEQDRSALTRHLGI